MTYIVFDLEYNCVPFNDNRIADAKLQNEIIQIGATKLNQNLLYISQFKSFVKPYYYKRLNQQVRRITKITQNQIDYAPNFVIAIRNFLKWIGTNDYIFCCWGDDIQVLNKHLEFYNISLKTEKYLDVQYMFTKYFNLNKPISLKNAVKILDINYYSNFHNAVHDANYTALILQELIRHEDFNLEYHPNDKINLEVKGFNQCPKCGKFSSKIDVSWIKYDNSKKYYRYCKCNNCNTYFNVVRHPTTIKKYIIQKEYIKE